MTELTLSVFEHGTASIERLKERLREFETEQNVRVHVETMGWDTGWPRLIEVALRQDGPDVSEIGSTWVMDFVHMNALRPFMRDEISKITGGARFFEATWKSCIASDGLERTIWAIPWAGDVRAVYYRRDLLEQAGVDETTAFTDARSFASTLDALQRHGVAIPLSLPTLRSRLSVHNLASWVWGAGGDFISEDGRRTLFTQQKTQEGFKTYFSLGRYLGDQPWRDEAASDEMFWSGQAAVTVSGYWLMQEPRITEPVRENLGITRLPGVPFVGGNNLIVWKHTRQPRLAVELIKFLSSPESAQDMYPNFGLPIRENGWSTPPFDRPEYQVLRQSFGDGRSFPNVRLWGLVEKRLTEMIPETWKQVIQNPNQVETIVEAQLARLATRLDTAING